MEKVRQRRKRFLGTALVATTAFSFIISLWLFVVLHAPKPLATDVPSIPIDLHDLTRMHYVINSNACSATEDEIYMLVMVGSHPSHGAERNVIRATWGNPKLANYSFRLVFLFGNLSDSWQNEALLSESRLHGDIVQGDFVDSFYNVTLRDLMGFQWAWYHCNRAKYIAKADDDVALDIYKVIERVEDQFESHRSDSICCYEIAYRAAPMRSGRYAMSYEDYDGRYYSDYCFGWIYILTPFVAKQLVDMSQSVKAIWINDVYITGILVRALGLNLYNINLKYTLKYSDMMAFGYYHLGDYDIGPTQGDVHLTRKIQQMYTNKQVFVTINDEHIPSNHGDKLRHKALPERNKNVIAFAT